MLFFPIQHVLKRSQTVVVIWQLTFVLWCILIRKWTKLKNVEKIGRKCVLQIDHCINSSVLCLWMPLLVCSLEAFERILLIWLDVTELFMGEKLPYFFFFFFCCGCDIFQNFQPAAQYHTEQSPIKHKTSAHLQKFSYWLSSLMSFFVVYMISCHDNKSKCFGICVTPFKSTDLSAHFKFITFVHFRSRGSK